MVSSILSEQKPAMLSESHRSRLADIVGRMESDGVATESIQEYVNAYKRKYTQNPAAKPVPPQDGGLGGGLDTLPTGLSDRQAAFETAKQNAGAKAGTYFKNEAAKRKAKTLNAEQTAQVLNDAAASVAGAFTDNPVMDAIRDGKFLAKMTLGKPAANLIFGPGEKGYAGHVAGAVGGVASAPFDIGADVVNFASKGEWQAGLNILLKSGALIVPAGKLASVGLKALSKTKAGIEFNAARGMKALLDSGIDPDKARAIVARIESGMPEAPPVTKGAEVVPTVARTPMSARREPASVPDPTPVAEPKPTPLKTVVMTDPKTGAQTPAMAHEFSDKDLLDLLNRKRKSAELIAQQDFVNANGKVVMHDVKVLQAEAERRGLRGSAAPAEAPVKESLTTETPAPEHPVISAPDKPGVSAGTPKSERLYHGTLSEFDDFSDEFFNARTKGPKGSRDAFFFSRDLDSAQSYAHDGSGLAPKFGRVIEADVSYSRPLQLDKSPTAADIARAKAEGYDAIVTPYEVAVFSPKQIKQAGSFDPPLKKEWEEAQRIASQAETPQPKPFVTTAKPVDLSPKAGKAGTPPQTGAQVPLGSTEGTFGTSNQAFEASKNLEAPVGKGQSAKSLVDDAAKSIDHEQALDLSRKIADRSEPYNPANAAKVQAGVAKLEGKVNDYAKLMDDAEEAGDAAAYQKYQESYQQAKANLQEFAQNVQKGKSEWSDVGRILATQVDEMGNFAAMQESLRRSKPKGVAVTEKESQLVKALAEDYNAKTKELEAAEAEIARLRAESTVQTVKRGPRFSKESLDAELDELLKEFNTAKSKLSAGLDPELLAIVGKIALNYGKRGINKLDEIVAAVQKHIPGIERQDVIDALAQKQETRTQSELAKRLAELRAEAKKLSSETQAKNLRKQGEKADRFAQQQAEKQATVEAKRQANRLRNAERLEREGRKEEAKKLRDDMKARQSQANKASRSATQMDEAAAKAQNKQFERESELQFQIKELERKIREKDFAVPTKAEVQASKRAELLQAKRDLIRKRFEQARKDAQPKTIGEKVVTVMNVPRTLKAQLDLSAPGRQGWLGAFMNPKAAGQGFVSQVKALGTEAAAQREMNIIMGSENAPLYQKSGVEFTDWQGMHGTEEAMLGNVLRGDISVRGKKIPNPAQATERAYNVDLNKQRAGMMDSYIRRLNKMFPKGIPEGDLKGIGNFVNVITGRGGASIPGFKNAAEFLSIGLFSPRFLASRIEFLTGAPIFKSGLSGRTRVLIAGEYAKVISGLATTIGIAYMGAKKLFGDENVKLGDNSTSSDFGKLLIRDGDEWIRVDLGAGELQPFVFGSKLAQMKRTTQKGDEVSLKGDAYGESATNEVGKFIRGKLNPALGIAWNLREGKDIVGKPYDAKAALWDAVAPLSIQQTIEDLRKDGWSKGDVINLLNFLGIGVNKY